MSNRGKLIAAITCVAISITLTGCPTTTVISSTGVTAASTESYVGIPNSNFPVPGVVVNFTPASSPGPNSVGTQSTFGGITGAGGLLQFPNAVTDITYSAYSNFQIVLPVCDTQTFQDYVPPGGAIIDFDCALF